MSLAHDPLLRGMLQTLRGTLHACAEPSGAEVLTAEVIGTFVRAYEPDALLTGLGGHGVAAVFEGAWEGPTVLVRAELDGLPVEAARVDGSPIHPPTSHRCGHDGHMTMVAGLAPVLAARRPDRGRVVLLFQPAEETGEGARDVVRDPRFARIRPDYAVALHNLPGVPLGTVVYRRGTFASASAGMKIRLRGVPSHAAEPGLARTPTPALARLLDELPALTDLGAEPYRMVTITHARMGRTSFGVTPGRAVLWVTLRSASTDGLERLKAEAGSRVHSVAASLDLGAELSFHDEFPETGSDDRLVGILEQVCAQEGIPSIERQWPYRWSEDFGHFASLCPVLYFGLGSGDTGGLHQPSYRFPDDILITGTRALDGVVRGLTSALRLGAGEAREAG
ncbi:MAG: amidohydrolase [Sandaracinaceae bacterium]